MNARQANDGQTIENVKIRVLPDGRITRKDAAKYLNVTPKTLLEWARNKKGPKAHKTGGRCFYYLADCREYVGHEAS